MMGIVWLIAHLITAASAAQEAPVMVGSCTYSTCMAKCSRLNGPACNTYCESKVAQRISAGLCPAPVDPDDFDGD